MRALSIRQPWAWMILHAGKDIENRDWTTTYRGRFLIHAGKTCTRRDYAAAVDFAIAAGARLPREILALEELPRGGIVGVAEIVDCVQASASPWFVGPNGFVIANPRDLPFFDYPGRLSWFDAPATKP